MTQPPPPGVDPNVPNVARIYDYHLGGKDNFAADRAAAEQMTALFPDVRNAARENRAFLARTVHCLVDAGVRQIVDIGSGLPTQGNVHEIAHALAPDCKVVYVDYDPVVVSHGQALLGRGENVEVVRADLRDVDDLLTAVSGEIDFDKPVAFLLFAILHFLHEADKPYEVVARLRDVSAPGSYLALSHATESMPEIIGDALEIYRKATASLALRSHAEILGFFDGYELLDPGLVYPRDWRPDADEIFPNTSVSIGFGGIGRKL
ncbi:SAM-dependent methyltransferase [Acrocarpospora catenulata]|uniref:SAM-dependent methyltransferase n=1 Tax=Acrocarpospora catenulata TaxID=2836182 RepID=UPI001BD9AF8B|nr:SAM-dependent methyltransferase [Acrocarpospora catenulata]